MTYTIPSNEIIAEAYAQGVPTQGQIEFAGKIRQEFSQFISDGLNVRDDAEVGYTIDDFVNTFDATQLFVTFRNVTGEDTDDIDHAMAVLHAAVSQAWDLIASDYETYSAEKV